MASAAVLLRRRAVRSPLDTLLRQLASFTVAPPAAALLDAQRHAGGSCGDCLAPRARALHAAAASCVTSTLLRETPGGLSPQQIRAAARVRRALSAAIGTGALAARFLEGNAFSVLEVHMSPDLRRAYVLWDAAPGQEERTERELVRSAVPLRAAVAKLVGLKHTPELHFRRNAVTHERRLMDEAWQALELERAEEAQQRAEPAGAAGASAGDAPRDAPPV